MELKARNQKQFTTEKSLLKKLNGNNNNNPINKWEKEPNRLFAKKKYK